MLIHLPGGYNFVRIVFDTFSGPIYGLYCHVIDYRRGLDW
jgi:hypothetical protein